MFGDLKGGPLSERKKKVRTAPRQPHVYTWPQELIEQICSYHSQGMRYSEIAQLIDRPVAGVCTAVYTASKKARWQAAAAPADEQQQACNTHLDELVGEV